MSTGPKPSATYATEKCEVCGGKGKLMVLQPPERCRQCNCTGRLSDMGQRCPRCGGSGWEGVVSARVAPGG